MRINPQFEAIKVDSANKRADLNAREASEARASLRGYKKIVRNVLHKKISAEAKVAALEAISEMEAKP